MFTHEHIVSFNELETIIYQYITAHSEQVVHMRVRDLADAAHVSPSTILRFCRKVDCEGFAELKAKLKISMEAREKKSLNNAHSTFAEFAEKTFEGRFDSAIKEVSRLAASSKSMIFAGSGSSGILAQYGSHYFSGLGKFSTYINDPFFPVYDDLRDTVTIALSVSGENKHTVNLVRKLKKEGSRIVSITNHKHCTLAKISEINIAYYITEERHHYTNITTQLPVLYLMESIAKNMYSLSNSR
ncbi:MurR/RpiR family transcriptional regulator [Domibacillus robiginosus]|uniref:MurR/RpiR family transcriptional regulator n=1 Tax=Domibacillus robiginosus TaxID=1071054 RepID=UPI00067CE05D|nr:MurR/RpiR family transcriptional regulator [Domibacillus robiginosus]